MEYIYAQTRACNVNADSKTQNFSMSVTLLALGILQLLIHKTGDFLCKQSI